MRRANYKELMLLGLHILDKLAYNEHNCGVISNTKGLLSKTVAPVSSDLLHHIDHDEWFNIVDRSMNMMSRLMIAPGETGANLRCEISCNKEAISSNAAWRAF